MWSYNHNNELYHYGVKGMKWGVRKEYKPVGRHKQKRVKNDDVKIKKITTQELRNYRQEMIDRYDKNAEKKKFYDNATDEQLRQDIDRKQKMKKIAAGVAVTAGIGVGIYCAYKYNSIKQIEKGLDKAGSLKDASDMAKKVMDASLHDTDIILDKGSVIHRMSAYADVDFTKVTNPTYVSYKEKDVLTYMTKLKDWSGTGKRYDVTLEAIEDIRMPSKKAAEKIFKEVWDSDPTYKDKLESTIAKAYTDIRTQQLEKFGEKIDDALRKELEKSSLAQAIKDVKQDPFGMAMYSIVRQGDDSKQLLSEFMKRGYNAIEDYFDKGSFTDSPVILFDPSRTIRKTGEQLVTQQMLLWAETRLSEIKTQELLQRFLKR